MDFTDFIHDDEILVEIEKLLLRHNSLLKQFFKQTSIRFEQHTNNENTFCFNLGVMWKILNECKILNSTFNICQINRLYFQGIKNKYSLNENVEILKQELEILKNHKEKIHFECLNDILLQGI